ncbi:MAG: cytochrome c peroxidase [Kofleriaceae bacterium]
MRWLGLLVLCGVVGCGDAEGAQTPFLGPPAPRGPAALTGSIEGVNPRLLRRFRPLRPPEVSSAEEVALGKMLYFDKRLSKHHDVSCNTCHALDHDGADSPKSFSVGTAGKRGHRNTPSTYNAGAHIALFWDGRAATLEAQANGPLVDEMAMDRRSIATTFSHIPGYVTAFSHAYPGEPIDQDHVTRALAAFERTLVTPSRWDRFLEGDRNALSRKEQDGLKLFADIGCVQCHTGELVGASMFQKAGVVEAWPNQKDQGRYDVTKLDSDRMVFKVPSLRNVLHTGPYFHDGSIPTLREAIAMMGKYQIGVDLTADEVSSIEVWLASLDGAPSHIDPPTLP